MVIHKASKCRLYPTKEQQNKINHTLGCCRYVYNKMLERQQRAYERRGNQHQKRGVAHTASLIKVTVNEAASPVGCGGVTTKVVIAKV